LVDTDTAVLAAQVTVLVLGFGYAAVADWRSREVTDRLWQSMGVAGLVLGAILLAPGGWVPLGLWLLVGAFTLQHMFAWSFGERFEPYEDVLEIVLYVVVIVLVGVAVFEVGLGSMGVPYAVLALLVTVLIARALFEAAILFGGADAKAVMVAGLVLPLLAVPLFVTSVEAQRAGAIVPYPLDLLMNAALLSVAIPIAIAIRNVGRRDLHGWKTFTGYTIPVRELPHRFVWVTNPLSPAGRAEEEEIETSEQDRQRRVRIAGELTAEGQTEVWVTPQIPYLLLLTAGAITALLAGNLVIDLIVLF